MWYLGTLMWLRNSATYETIKYVETKKLNKFNCQLNLIYNQDFKNFLKQQFFINAAVLYWN